MRCGIIYHPPPSSKISSVSCTRTLSGRLDDMFDSHTPVDHWSRIRIRTRIRRRLLRSLFDARVTSFGEVLISQSVATGPRRPSSF